MPMSCQGHLIRVMQSKLTFQFVGMYQTTPPKVWPATAKGCNHQSLLTIHRCFYFLSFTARQCTRVPNLKIVKQRPPQCMVGQIDYPLTSYRLTSINIDYNHHAPWIPSHINPTTTTPIPPPSRQHHRNHHPADTAPTQQLWPMPNDTDVAPQLDLQTSLFANKTCAASIAR